MINYWISLPRFDAVSEVQFMYIYSTVVLSTLLGNLSSFHYTAPYTFYVAGLERYHVEQRLVPIVIEAVFYSNLKTALFCRVGSGALLSRKSFRSGKSFGSRTLTHRTIAHRTVTHRTIAHKTFGHRALAHKTFATRTFTQDVCS